MLNCYIGECANSESLWSHPLIGNSEIKISKSTKAKYKILIKGDSHTQWISSEIQYNLDDDFEIQGIVKPGSDLAAIMHAVNKDTGALTKYDAVVLWSGIRDISRNETQKGLCQFKKLHG